ncbi:hypothetical protein C0992_008011, partial [Termitomyces sp. T32_za158]
MSAQTTRATMCLGFWSHLGLVKDKGVLMVAKLDEVPAEEGLDGKIEMPDGWD